MKKFVSGFVNILFNIWKGGISEKIVLGFLRFVSILFLIFEKGDKQKIVLGFLRFVSILF